MSHFFFCPCVLWLNLVEYAKLKSAVKKEKHAELTQPLGLVCSKLASKKGCPCMLHYTHTKKKSIVTCNVYLILKRFYGLDHSVKIYF